MPVEIQVLQQDDTALLGNVAAGVFDDPINPDAVRAFLSDVRHHLVVARDDETVVGFASAVHYLHPDKAHPELWINEVGVAPTHQAQGLGKALLRALLDIARNLGCVEAWVLTERSNTPALRLYTSLGGTQDSGDTVMFTFQL